jgi:hypothetical protein
LYYPPEFKSPFVWVYNERGQLIQQIYPSNYRYVTYIKDSSDELKKIIWDHSSIEITKQVAENKLLVKTIVTTPRYRVSNERIYIANMLVDAVNNVEAGRLVNSQFKYGYDTNRRLTSLQVFVENNDAKTRIESKISIKYKINTKFYEKINDFQFLRNLLSSSELTIKDSTMNMNLRNDDSAHLTEISMKIRNILRFKANYEYDEKSRLKSFNYKINENLFDETNTAYIKELIYSYQYDANDRLVQVSVAKPNLKKIKVDEQLWQINYDSHGNSILEEVKNNKNKKQLNLQINGADQLMILDRDNAKIRYNYDSDGFIYKRSDSTEETLFVFDSNQLLTKVKINASNNKTIEYFYDDRRRLIARKHYTGYSIQYFYADETRPNLITHVYDQNTMQLMTYYYTDDTSRLFAVEREGIIYYIVADLLNSPMIVYDSYGKILNQYLYDPFGYQINDDESVLNGKFQLYLTFKAAISDQEAGILFLDGGSKAYDPKSGRYLAPNIDCIQNILQNPTNINLYQAFTPRPYNDQDEIYFKGKFLIVIKFMEN